MGLDRMDIEHCWQDNIRFFPGLKFEYKIKGIFEEKKGFTSQMRRKLTGRKSK